MSPSNTTKNLPSGIITDDERVELIEGQVIPMSAKNPPHAATTLCASDYLKRLLAEVALVRVQDPILLSQYSELEPDIAVVQIDAIAFYVCPIFSKCLDEI